MPELLTALGGIRTGAGLIKGGWNQLKKLFPVYPKIWRTFESKVKNDRDTSWDQIQKNCELQFEFVGSVLGLYAAEDASQERLRDHFRSFLELKEDAEDDRETVIERFVRAVEDAANQHTKESERELIQRRLADAATRAEGDRSRSHTTETSRLAVEEIRQKGASREQVDEILTLAREDREWRTRMEDRMAALETQQQAELLPELSLQARFLTGAEEEQSTPNLDLVAESGTQTVEDILDELRAIDPEAATDLQARIETQGFAAVAGAIEDPQRPDASLSLRVAEAQILSKDGYFKEAERGFLLAADLTEDGEMKARQFVRAAAMAGTKGAEGRRLAHLAEAERINPGDPGVAIAEARELRDADAVLARLDGLNGRNSREVALIHATRAQALLVRDEERANAELALALEADPDNHAVREIEAISAWNAGRKQLAAQGSADREALVRAGDQFAELASRIAEEQRFNEAAFQVARGAECYGLAGDLESAAKLLATVESQDDLDLEPRLELAEASIISRRPELVETFLRSSDTSEDAQMLRSEGVLLADVSSAEEKRRAASAMEKLLASSTTSEDIKLRIAFSLIAAAAADANLEWNESAAEIVKAKKPVAEAEMRAERHWTLGEPDEASAALLPFASYPGALGQLRDYALRSEDWTKARDLSLKRMDLVDDPVDRYRYATALAKLKSLDESRREFLELGEDGTAPPILRGMAFGGAGEIDGNRRDYKALADVARRWQKNLPGDLNGVWNEIFALARLSKSIEGLEVFRRESPDPVTPEQATLVAELYYRATPKAEALAEISRLSDRFNREIEALEVLTFMAGVEAEQLGEHLSDELGERLRETVQEFPDRFPDSDAIQAIRVTEDGSDPADLARALEAHVDAQGQQDAQTAVAEGVAPAFVVGQAAGRSNVINIWHRLTFLPLGFGMAELDALDLQAARDAVGGAAVWDSSSLYVAGGFAETVLGAIEGSLPGSRIATETLEDADDAPSYAPVKGGSETIHDATGALVGIREFTDGEVESAQRTAESAAALAKRLSVERGVGDDSPAGLQELYEGNDGRAWRALLSTMAVAQRTATPIYSDDRWVRQAARLDGVPAFGSIALVIALLQRGVIDAEAATEARLQMAAGGGGGLNLTSAELIAAGETSKWRFSPTLAGGIRDRAAWRARPADHIREVLGFLQRVYEKEPELFETWVHRVIEAGQQSVPELAKSFAARTMILVGMDVGQERPQLDKQGFHQLVRAVDRRPFAITEFPKEDTVLSAVAELMDMVRDQPDPVRVGVFVSALSRLPALRGFDAFQAFVAPAHSAGG